MPLKTNKRKGKMLGGYVPTPVREAVDRWVGSAHERTLSKFLREAAREKLRKAGIHVSESGFGLLQIYVSVFVLCLMVSFCVAFFTRLTAGYVIGAVAVICGAAIAMLLRQQKKDQS